MTGVQEPIELSAAPSAVNVKVDVEWLADLAHGVDREPGGALPLQLRDAPSADACAAGEIQLTPSKAQPDRAHDLPKGPIHAGILRGGALPAAYSVLTVRWHHQCR